MTAPTVIRRKGPFEGLPQAFSPLLNALAQRQQFGLQRQKLEIERQKAEASIAQAGAATAESRGRTKGLLEELKQKEIQLRANDAASERFISTRLARNSSARATRKSLPRPLWPSTR